MSLTIRNIRKSFGACRALDNVSLDVPAGTLLALLGPSGSGKTTLLRIIAGLEFPDSGNVLSDDTEVTKQTARDRNVGFVFQHYGLFRHMTVFENVAFPLRVRHRKNSAVAARVGELLHLVRLEGMEQRLPAQLSGGQRQRVALARALAAQPRLLLLDEPFGALDAQVRKELRQWLRRFHDDMGVTSIFVTHDQEEAFEVADQVVIMGHGRVQQIGTPAEIFEHPANSFVMDFLGHVNVFHGRVQNGKALLGDWELEYPEYRHAESRLAHVYVRPHEVEIDRDPMLGIRSVAARVMHINPAGVVAHVHLDVPELGLEVNVDLAPERLAELQLQRGDAVFVAPKKMRVFLPDYSI